MDRRLRPRDSSPVVPITTPPRSRILPGQPHIGMSARRQLTQQPNTMAESRLRKNVA